MSASRTVEIPGDLARHAVEVFGAAGEQWIHELPTVVADLARKWEVAVGAPFELSYSYVARALRADGTEVVLKVAVPDSESRLQIEALRLYEGEGACRLLAAEPERYAMLLERLRPGDTLVGVAVSNDEAATRIGAEVMRRLWRPAPKDGSFPPLRVWFERAFARHRAEYGGAGPFPAALLERSEALAGELLGSTPRKVLLHADFHHFNVLSAERAPWLAIDPKGMVGDPGYEAGPFLLNPWKQDWILRPRVLSRRLDVLSEMLDYDRTRLRDWGIAHAVLSACWTAENGRRGWEPAIATAEILHGL